MPRPRKLDKEAEFFDLVANGATLNKASIAVGWDKSYGCRVLKRVADELGADRDMTRGNNNS
jgi:hypothetical protein